MSERLSIRRGDVEIAGPVQMLKLTVRNGSQLDHVLRQTQLLNQCCRRLGAKIPWVIPGTQPGRQKQLWISPRKHVAKNVESPQQCFKVAEVVVVTHKEQTQAVARG